MHYGVTLEHLGPVPLLNRGILILDGITHRMGATE
jgi:hypothetical protein